MAKTKKATKKRKKSKKIVPRGKVYIQSTFNNTIITLTDEKGDVLSWTSAGTMGYKGTRKSTPYAAGLAARKITEDAKLSQTERVDVFVRGVGSGRESAVRALNSAGLIILSIKDVTPIPHNGPRPKKARRV